MSHIAFLDLLAAFSAALGSGLWAWTISNYLLWRGEHPPALGPLGSTKKILLTPKQKLWIGVFMAGLFAMLLLDAFTGIVLTSFFILGWYAYKKAPSFWKKWDWRKRQAKISEVFPPSLGMAVQALKTGQTLPQVLDYLSRESPSPLREEWVLACREMDLGSSAEQALAKIGEKYPGFPEFQQFLESYKISRRTGANLTHLLEVLLDGLEEKNRILRKMEAMTAQARLSGLMMGLLPLLLGAVFFCMDPNLILPLFTEKMGWGILGAAVALESIGFYWISQLLKLEV